MEFDKSRVFTSLNADELRAGDKVIVSYNLYGLKEQVKMFTESAIDVIEVIQDEDYFNRFKIKHGESFLLAYLVERKENCTNCEELGKAGGCCPLDDDDGKTTRCWLYKPKTENNCTNCSYSCKSINPCLRYEPKTEQKAEKHYRPFKDTDELIKVWGSRCNEGKGYILNSLDMPHIWVRYKNLPKSKGMLINGFEQEVVYVMGTERTMQEVLDKFVFLDGTPCGVEE